MPVCGRPSQIYLTSSLLLHWLVYIFLLVDDIPLQFLIRKQINMESYECLGNSIVQFFSLSLLFSHGFSQILLASSSSLSYAGIPDFFCLLSRILLVGD